MADALDILSPYDASIDLSTSEGQNLFRAALREGTKDDEQVVVSMGTAKSTLEHFINEESSFSLHGVTNIPIKFELMEKLGHKEEEAFEKEFGEESNSIGLSTLREEGVTQAGLGIGELVRTDLILREGRQGRHELRMIEAGLSGRFPFAKAMTTWGGRVVKLIAPNRGVRAHARQACDDGIVWSVKEALSKGLGQPWKVVFAGVVKDREEALLWGELVESLRPPILQWQSLPPPSETRTTSPSDTRAR